MTAGFSYRYALAAVPATCLAAGLAFAGRGSFLPGGRTEHPPVLRAGLFTWLRDRKTAKPAGEARDAAAGAPAHSQ
jgi:hypothetical protein